MSFLRKIRKEVFPMPVNSISRKVTSMDELSNKKVVQHNDLIKSVAQMETVPLKFFELAVACLDTENVPPNRTVHVSKELLFSFFDAKSESKHTYFRDILMKLHKEAVFYMRELDKKKKLYEYRIISPLESTSWNDSTDDISFQFTESIMPFLVELKRNFTQYLLSDIGKLDSKYSIVLYKWISMNYNQYENYKHKGGRTDEQLRSLKNPLISAEEIRIITNTENKYKRPADFFKRVVDVAVSEITKKTVFNVEYVQNRKGNRFSSLQFFVTKKHVAKNEFYKEEEQDPAYLQEKEDKKQGIENLYAAALESNYTDFLGDYMLISFKDIRDKELMAGLQKSVYPLYDKLAKLKGGNAVKKHISYVSSKIEDYSKKNIVRYLHEAISNYLPRANIESNPEKMFEDL